MTEGPWLDREPWGMSPALAARMERVAREVAADWGLVLGPRIGSGRYSYVAPAGDDAVLKVVPPEDDDADHIADALAFWDGAGAVRLPRHDEVRIRRWSVVRGVLDGLPTRPDGPEGDRLRIARDLLERGTIAADE